MKSSQGDGSDVSRQMGRTGYYFPTDIVRRAHALNGSGTGRSWLIDTRNGPTYNDEGFLNGSMIRKRLDHHARRLRGNKNLNQRQSEIQQTEATIRELFPRIPEDDIHAIVDRAFGKVWLLRKQMFRC